MLKYLVVLIQEILCSGFAIIIILGICTDIGESNENWDDISLKFYSFIKYLNFYNCPLISFLSSISILLIIILSILTFSTISFREHNFICDKKEKDNRNPFNRAIAAFYFGCGGSYGYQVGISTLFIALDTLQTTAEK